MNYIKQLNAFYSTLEYDPLSANAISLYHALLNVNNRCRWIAEFKCANTVLSLKSGLSMSSLQRARNELTQKDLVRYKKGANRSSVSKYSVVVLYEQVHGQVSGQVGGQVGEQVNDVKLNTLSKHKEKQKEKTVDVEASALNVDVQKIQKAWSNAGMGVMSPASIKEIVTYLNDGMEADCIEFAIKEADLNGARNFAYVKTILNRLMNEGIKTKIALIASQQELDKKRRGTSNGTKNTEDPYGIWR